MRGRGSEAHVDSMEGGISALEYSGPRAARERHSKTGRELVVGTC